MFDHDKRKIPPGAIMEGSRPCRDDDFTAALINTPKLDGSRATAPQLTWHQFLDMAGIAVDQPEAEERVKAALAQFVIDVVRAAQRRGAL